MRQPKLSNLYIRTHENKTTKLAAPSYPLQLYAVFCKAFTASKDWCHFLKHHDNDDHCYCCYYQKQMWTY